MSALDQVYARLPVAAQHAAVTAFGLYWYALRFGPGFRHFVEGYKARDRFTESQWAAWQADRLKRVLGVAVSQVPYYRDTFTEGEKRAALAGNVRELPLLNKDAIRANPHAFVRQDRRPPSLAFPTSGTTGTPIVSLYTRRELRDSLAVREVRSAGWAGVSFRQPRATFSGRMVEPDPESKGPYHRFNAVERQVYLSPFHLRPDTAERYVDALRRHRVQWLTGYAVSYYLLAQFILEQKLTPPPLKAVVTTSEKLTVRMRKVMEQAYHCRIWEEYSTVENVVFASECEEGRLHSSPDVALVEILRPDGTACNAGEVGEVVATSLSRDHQLLVRFRLGDLASWATDSCPCGRGMPVLREVVGRVEDVVIGPDGRQLVRFHGVFVQGVRIAQGQIIQETLNRIRVKVVPDTGYTAEDAEEITRRVRQRLGGRVEVVVEAVVRISTTAAGKAPGVISLLRTYDMAQVERTGVEEGGAGG